MISNTFYQRCTFSYGKGYPILIVQTILLDISHLRDVFPGPGYLTEPEISKQLFEAFFYMIW